MNRRSLLKNKKELLPISLCFALPFVIACISYAILGLYPFGNGQLLAHDQWHQYYPYFVALREKLLDGSSLQYTWDVGMGTGYASLFAYYLASPLNLFSVFVPEFLLREYFALMTVLKISFAGLFFGIFLRTTFRKVDFTLPFFALMYAFCSWAGGYAWNNIWLDVFALLPLLIAGTVSLLREGRFRLYIAALGLSLWCNYYIAYFCCIFVLLCFIGYCLLCWKGFKNFFLRFLRIGIGTLLGIGLAAVLLLPTLAGMGATVSATGDDFNWLAMNTMVSGAYGSIGEGGIVELLKTETLPGLLNSTRTILSHLLTGTAVNKFDETFPNVFCSLSAVMLALYGLFNKKIPLKEKIFNILLLGFISLSFILRVLDYVWHGFHFPNMLYHRFSFLFSFVLIAAAYRSFTQLRHANKWSLFAVIPLMLGLLVNYFFTAEPVSKVALLSSFAVTVGVTAVLVLYRRKKLLRRIAVIGLCCIITCEMTLCWGLAVRKIGYTSRDQYPWKGEYIEALLDYTEETDDELFYRTELTYPHTLNDSALNDYRGVSIFTSSANVNFNRFGRSLGLSSWPGSNRFSYYEAMPFTNTLCGIKYLIDRTGGHYNTDYNLLVANSDNVNLLKNEAYIGMGFMTEEELQSFVSTGMQDVIASQNKMFRLATGEEAPLYTEIEHDRMIAAPDCTFTVRNHTFSYDTTETEDDAEFRIVYEISQDGLYCFTSSAAHELDDIEIHRNGEKMFKRSIDARSLFTVGTLKRGDKLEVVFEMKPDVQGAISIDAAVMDYAAFDRGMEKLKDEPWVLTEVTDTSLSGTVEVKEDGFFYTSIPYEPGWRAYVDGKEVPIGESYDTKEENVKITDAVISFPLSAGTHTVTVEYTAPGLRLGAIISGSCLLIFLLLVFLLRKRPLLLPDRHALEEYELIPAEEEDWEDEEIQLPEEDPSGMEEFDFEAILQEFSPEPEAFEAPTADVQEFTDPISPDGIPFAEETLTESEE